MAKARAIVKRRKAVRNIRKITKTMQMIATAKFQKSLKRAVGTKPYTVKVRELVTELADSGVQVKHPLLRRPGQEGDTPSNRAAVVVLTSNRGLAGAYNGSVLRTATTHLRQLDAAGTAVDLYVSGKKGVSYFAFQKRPMAARIDQQDPPRYADIERAAGNMIDQFVRGQVDAVYVVYMNFISTGVQRPDVMTLLPLSGLRESVDRLAHQLAEKEAQIKAGALDARRSGADVAVEPSHAGGLVPVTTYDFSPGAEEILGELLPLTVKTALWQAVLDAATSEHVARMVSMKSATDNADKMAKALTMQYNRARQSQITTELSEIMGGVEAMKGKG
jgi:F-type H+-transporting ATPase subunit gamma